MTNLCERIREAARVGQLTPSDLATWFERPYPTVRTWLVDGREPETFLEETEQRLYKLEHAIACDLFPVPYGMSAHKRPSYIEKVRGDVLKSGLSEAHPSN